MSITIGAAVCCAQRPGLSAVLIFHDSSARTTDDTRAERQGPNFPLFP
jgi:hypothetical protein